MKLRHLSKPIATSLCVGGAVLAGTSVTCAQDSAKLDKLERENAELRKRLDALETAIGKDGGAAGGGNGFFPLKALSDTTLGGFVTASYIYDTSEPDDNSPNGYLWNRRHNSFSINKVKVSLAKPAEQSGEKWSAGYKFSLIFGEDAPVVNTGGEFQGLEALREAYVDLNIPVGTGLNVKAGQLISLLNFESGDGGSANPNFSQGYQWFFTGNGPSAGVQVGYSVNEHVDLKARVQNGMFTGAIDNNGYKTMMGSIGIKPVTKTGISLIGFGGREGASSGNWLKGGSLIASRQLTEKYNLNFATELDYFNADVGTSGTAEWWSVGGWLWADITSKIGVALRGDYIGDQDGAGTSGLLGFPVHGGQDLYSATFTLNLRPLPNIKIQPEIRYDHTSLSGGFDGEENRVMLGVGISYLF